MDWTELYMRELAKRGKQAEKQPLNNLVPSSPPIPFEQYKNQIGYDSLSTTGKQAAYDNYITDAQNKEVPEEMISEFANLVPRPAKIERGYGEAGLDLLTTLGKSTAGVIKSGADAFGINNPVSNYLQDNIKTLEDNQSNAYKDELKLQAEEKQAYQDKGALSNIGLYLKQMARNPGMTAAEAIGNVAPFLVTGGLGGAAGLGARALIGLQGLQGAALGAGAVKGEIADRITNASDEQLLTDENYKEFRKTLDEASAKKQLSELYSSYAENPKLIGLGAAAGIATGLTGTQNIIANALGKNALKSGLFKDVFKEVITEIPQESFETYAGGLGAKKGGASIDEYQGVLEAGTKAGVMAGLGAGVVGVASKLSNNPQKPQSTLSELEGDYNAGTNQPTGGDLQNLVSQPEISTTRSDTGVNAATDNNTNPNSTTQERILTDGSVDEKPRVEEIIPASDTITTKDIEEITAAFEKNNQTQKAKPFDELPEAVQPDIAQNKLRDRVESIDQVRNIASKMDYSRIGTGNTPYEAAPMVSIGANKNVIPEENIGKRQLVVMPNNDKIETYYAVVNSNDIVASHDKLNRPRDDYNKRQAGNIYALNNVRTIAKQVYDESGNKSYVKNLIKDATNHGISPAAIAKTPNATLVRVFDDRKNNLKQIGARSNANSGSQLSTMEIAMNDAPALDMSLLDTQTELSSANNQAFIGNFAKNKAQTGDSLSDHKNKFGEVLPTIYDRMKKAIFYKAYGNEYLLSVLTENANDDIKNLTNAMLETSKDYAALPETELNKTIKNIISQAIIKYGNAKNKFKNKKELNTALISKSLVEYDGSVNALALFFADNASRVGAIKTALQTIGETLLATQNEGVMFDTEKNPFGDETTQGIINKLYNKANEQIRSEYGDRAKPITIPEETNTAGSVSVDNGSAEQNQRKDGGDAENATPATNEQPIGDKNERELVALEKQVLGVEEQKPKGAEDVYEKASDEGRKLSSTAPPKPNPIIKEARESGLSDLTSPKKQDTEKIKAAILAKFPKEAKRIEFVDDDIKDGVKYSSPFNGKEQAKTKLPEDVTTIEVDGVERPALNSNGKPIHWSEEGIRNFWRWFGDSKVVDDEGRPLVVYHGTERTSDGEAINVFHEGSHFGNAKQATNRLNAKRYYHETMNDYEKTLPKNQNYLLGKDRESIYPVYLKVDEYSSAEDMGDVWWKRKLELWKQEGNNNQGIHYYNDHEGEGRSWFVFSPTQIKSATGNTGEFNPDNPDIRYSTTNNDFEAYYNGTKDKIVINLSGIKAMPELGFMTAESRALAVVAHELGHRGKAVLDKNSIAFNKVYNDINKNATIRKLADAIYNDRQAQDSQYHVTKTLAIEEAAMVLIEAQESNNYDYVKAAYGVSVPVGLRKNLSGMIARFIENIKAWFKSVSGADVDAYKVIRQMWNARNKEMVEKIADYVENGTPISQWMKKVAMAMMASAVIINPANGQNITQIQGVDANVQSVVEHAVKDGDGRNFVVADKKQGLILVYAQDGKLITSAPALFGKNVGDNAIKNNTPAGAFELTKTLVSDDQENSYGGDVMVFKMEANGAFAVHRVLDKQNRVNRLATPRVDDNRITNGCINVPSAFYDKYLSGMDKSKIYVIPETRNKFSTRPLSEEERAKLKTTSPELLELEKAQAGLVKAQDKFDRLFKSNSIDNTQTDSARIALTKAKAQLVKAQKAVDELPPELDSRNQLSIDNIGLENKSAVNANKNNSTKIVDDSGRYAGVEGDNFLQPPNVNKFGYKENINARQERLFSTTPKLTGKDSELTALFKSLAADDEAFQITYPKSKALADIAKEIDGKYKIRFMGKAQEWGNNQSWMIEYGDRIATAYMYGRGNEVWVNVADLHEGQDRGSEIYAMVAAYAYNNGKVFVGDPEGLSKVAYARRTENMISSILKYGTSDHLYPHEAQVNPKSYYNKETYGDFAESTTPLKWKVGDTENNLEELLKASYNNVTYHLPEIKDIIYDFDKRQFWNTRSNSPVYGFTVKQIAGREISGLRAGSATLKRSALINTFLRQRSSTGDTKIGGRNELLAKAISELLGGLDLHPQLIRTLYSTKPRESGVFDLSEADDKILLMKADRPKSLNNFPDVVLIANESKVKSHPEYREAKIGGCIECATNLVSTFIDDKTIENIQKLIGEKKPIVSGIAAEERDGRNLIPIAMQNIISDKLNLVKEDEIYQKNYAGHTGQDGFFRLATPALFDGKVESGMDYLVIDDFVGQGGTLANLIGYINAKGGNVVGAVALTGKPYSAKLAPTELINELRKKHNTSSPSLEDWWRGRFGYGFDKLTRSEARYLLRTENADRIRDKIIEASEKRSPPKTDEIESSIAPLNEGRSLKEARESGVSVLRDNIFKALSKLSEKQKSKIKVISKEEAELQGNEPLMVAWHGSPHDFEKFTTEKIGTGEGAQAYGWGMYFAGNKAVAEYYRKALTEITGSEKFKWNGKVYSRASVEGHALGLINDMGIASARKWAKTFIGTEKYSDKPSGYFDKFNEVVNKVNSIKDFEVVRGTVYQVDLKPTEDEYLLWDKPLREQSDKVKLAIKKSDNPALLNVNRYMKGEDIYRNVRDTASAIIKSGAVQNRDGRAQATSEYLKSLGIRGIKYLDGSSRNKGEGNYNYVIFDDGDVEIQNKESRLADNVEGYFNPKTGEINLIAENIKAVTDKNGKVLMTAEDRAVWVALHELMHRGLATPAMMTRYKAIINSAKTNPIVNKLSEAISKERGDISEIVAVEEALAEIRAADDTNNWEHLRDRYGIEIKPFQKNIAKNALTKFIEKVRRFIGEIIGKPITELSDNEVMDLVREVASQDTDEVDVGDGGDQKNSIGKNVREALKELYRYAKEKGNELRIVEIAKVNSEEIIRAKENAKIDINDFVHIADSYGLRHIDKGNGKSLELLRGQMVILESDIENIPQVIKNPNTLVYGMKNNQGLNTIVSIKTFENGTTLVVQEVRTGNKHLAVQSMWKYPATKDAHQVAQVLLSNARGDSGNKAIIVDLANKSNKKFSTAPFDGKEQAKTKLPEGVTTIEVDGVERPALNSNGKPIHWSEEGIRNFWRWFGDSKVVDEQGRPLVVYHGTDAEFNTFEPTQPNFYASTEGWYFFTDNKLSAQQFGDKLIEAYLKINNPTIETQGRFNTWSLEDDGEAYGFIAPNTDTGNGGIANQYVVEKPTQIKSATGNTGEFNPDNPDIRYSTAPPKSDTQTLARESGLFVNQSSDYEELLSSIEGKIPDTKINVNQLKSSANEIIDKINTAVHDSVIPAIRWIESLPINKNLSEELIDNYRLSEGKRDNIEVIARDEHLFPIYKLIATVANQQKITVTKAREMVGYWLSARYAPFANEWLIHKDKQSVESAKAELAKATGDDIATAKMKLTNAEKQLANRIYDVNNKNIKDVVIKAGVAGGMSNARAEALKKAVEARIPLANLEAIADKVYAMMGWKKQLDITTGRVSKEVSDKWLNHKWYVPLTGSPNADYGTDLLGTGTSIPNVTKDRALNGRKDSIAEDAISAINSAIIKSATHAGFQEFKRSLNDVYEDLESKFGKDDVADKFGLSRELETHQRVSDSNIIYRDNGNSFVFNFDNKEVVDALRKQNVEHQNTVMQTLAGITSVYARLATLYNITFAPVNWTRDVWEKSELIRTRDLGNVNNDQIARRMIALQLSPEMHSSTVKFAFEKEDNSLYGQYLKEIISGGAMSTWAAHLGRTQSDIDADIKANTPNLIPVFRKKLGKFFSAWNNSFEFKSSLSAYIAMREAGINPNKAQAITLDLMNFHKKGAIMAPFKAFYIFLQPSIIGSANLLKLLSTRKGQVRFTAYIIIGSMLYAMLREMGDDDEAGKKIDNLSPFVLDRYIPIPMGDTIVKIPIGFGMPMLAWNISQNLVKGFAGEQTPLETAAEIAIKSNVKSFSPFGSSEIPFSKEPLAYLLTAFAPTLTKPMMQLAVNKSMFGQDIVPSWLSNKEFKSEQGRKETAEFYKELATVLREITGIDSTPEQVRVFVQGYSIGHFRDLLTTFIENPNSKRLDKPTKMPILSRFVDTYNNFAVEGSYYETKDKAENIQREVIFRVENGENETNVVNKLSSEDKAIYKWFIKYNKEENKLRGNKSSITKKLNKGLLTPTVAKLQYKLVDDSKKTMIRKAVIEMRNINKLPTKATQ